MKNRYSITVLLCIISFASFGQSNYPMETVGTPASPAPVNSYAGWINNGLLTFNGDAQVQNVNSSNNLSASGGGNVFFTNTVGTYLQIAGFNPSSTPASMDVTFDMYGYNPSNLSELILEYSTDGINYTELPYRRLFRNYMPPTPWDIMVSDPLPASVGFSNLKIRFRQTTATQQFRVDDIEANFYSALPVSLTSFSAAKIKSAVQVNWRASSTDENEYFVVERSTDGRHFAAVSNNIMAKGIGEFAYNYADKLVAEKTFYRLKVVDVSGRPSYSQVIFLQAVNVKADLIQAIYPVPARDVLNTQLLSNDTETALLTLTDLSGRIVMNRSFSVAPGINNCALNVGKLNSGMYILRIYTHGTIETRSILIE
jgi:hypothetical protein